MRTQARTFENVTASWTALFYTIMCFFQGRISSLSSFFTLSNCVFLYTLLHTSVPLIYCTFISFLFYFCILTTFLPPTSLKFSCNTIWLQPISYLTFLHFILPTSHLLVSISLFLVYIFVLYFFMNNSASHNSKFVTPWHLLLQNSSFRDYWFLLLHLQPWSQLVSILPHRFLLRQKMEAASSSKTYPLPQYKVSHHRRPESWIMVHCVESK